MYFHAPEWLYAVRAHFCFYAHFVLGMSKTDIARAEGVDEKVVRLAIERGLRNMEKFSKK